MAIWQPVPQYDEERSEPAKPPPSSGRRWLKGLGFARVKSSVFWLVLIDILLIAVVLFCFDPLITLLRRNEELFGHRLAVSRNLTSEGRGHQARHRVPRILHQTCKNETIREEWVKPQQSCIDAYSDFEYMLWTDDGAREFLAQHYPWFLDTWDAYPFPIQRADSIRYFILYHYGGIYLDMDTFCVEPFPLVAIDSDTVSDIALFKTTRPTGITNDFMVSTARHPAFESAIHQLPGYYSITRLWARLEPYCAIMISSGPFFITLVLKNYLLKLPSLPSPTFHVVSPSQLDPYLTDLESSTWHRTDTQLVMWIGDRPWTWYTMGAIGLCVGMYIFNYLLLKSYRSLRNIPHATHNSKLAKLI